MGLDRWPLERDPTVLGAVVHGPAVVAESPGIALAVRCVLARPGGLELDLVLRAVGVQAEAANRQSFGEPHVRGRGRGGAEPGRGGSELDLAVEIDGRRAVVHPFESSASGGEGERSSEFTSELRVAVGVLPTDGRITLVCSWRQAGLGEGGTTLTLASLDGLEDRVVHLPVEA